MHTHTHIHTLACEHPPPLSPIRLPCVDEQVGKAQHIQFDPLRAHSVSIPAGGVCVVANSLVEASQVGVVCVYGGGGLG
jgi:hypothetical protein